MTSAAPPAVSVRGLRKRYGATTALDDLSFDVARGETFGLLGPNGAGKTTSIAILTGVLAADGGEARVEGGDPREPSTRRRLGVAPQSLALYEDLTGEENLSVFGRVFGLTRTELAARIAWCLDFAGLAERGRDRVSAYSGGMKRRLNLACALVHDPPVLLLDEPTVGVDPQSRNHMFEAIERLAAQGRTILYTTHYMEEAERLCDRVAIVDHGRALDVGPVDALVARHGGRSVVEVDFDGVPTDLALPVGRLEGTRLVIDTDRPTDAIADVVRRDLPYVEIRVRRPNLETAFLVLTGRRLRDA